MDVQSSSSQNILETQNVIQNNGNRKRKKPKAKTPNIRPKTPTMSSKSIEHFKLIEDVNGTKSYKCSLCSEDAKLVNGTKTGNLSQHLKHVHSQFFLKILKRVQKIHCK